MGNRGDITAEPQDIRQFPVSVLMHFKVTQNNFWSSGQWEANGLIVGEIGEKITGSNKQLKQVLQSDAANSQYLWSGFTVELHKDECESYYHNLMSDTPKAFIVCRSDEEDNNQCQPFLVTLSYDEAASYMEVDELVYSVAMPPELYRCVEQFVLEHYVPEKKRKRRRDNWKETPERDSVK
ncbi:DUF3305 domain-containing protein [Kaarinaea lacus]